jgi:hypothetical protein
LKHTYLVALSSAVLLAGVSVSPAYASTTVSCSGGGNFTVSGSIVTRTNPAFTSTCTGIASIPDSVTEIAAFTFLEAVNLTGVTFGSESSLTIIRSSAFSESGLTSITIPATVTTIESFAFSLMPSLTSVTFESGSLLSTLGVKAFAQNPLLTSVTFRGMSAPASVAEDAFFSIGAEPQLFLEDGATGFGSVGETWKGLKIAAGGTIVTPDPDPTPDPTPAPAPAPGTGAAPAFTPPPPASPEVTSRSLVLNTAVLAKQQKKVLRTLIAEVGAGGSFEVVAGIARQEGLSKQALRALARDNAEKIKKYLVKRGIKGRDVSLKTKIYKVGRSSKVEVLVSKPSSS